MSKKLFIVGLVVFLFLSLGGCASKEERYRFLDAQLKAVALQKPLVHIEAQPGMTISGLKSITVYAPQGQSIRQFRDPWVDVTSGLVGALGAVAGSYVNGLNMVALADSIGTISRPIYNNSYNRTAPPPKPVIVTQPAPIIVKGGE